MLTEAFPILTTQDLPRSLRFYRDLLGFTETYRFPAEDEPGYVALELGTSSLGIAEDAGIAGLAPPPDSPHRFELCCYADSCDAVVERLRVHGVPVLAEPAEQPWGERMARVQDPDGNRVIILSQR